MIRFGSWKREREREVEPNGCAKKNKRLSLHIFFPTPKTDTKRKNQEKENPLSVSRSLPSPQAEEKKRKTNLATGKVGRRQVNTQILYTIHDLPTNHGIPPTGAMQFVSKEAKKKTKKGKKKRPYGRDRHLVLGQSSRRHSHMRAHQTRRGNAHVWGSSKTIEFSWWRRGRWCVRGDTGCQLFEGG